MIRAFVAVGTFVLLFAADASAQSGQPPEPPAAQGGAQSEQEDAAPNVSAPNIAQAEAEKAERETAEQRRSRDTQTWLAFAQVILGAFTLAGLWYARKSALAAKVSADVAKQALEGLERPYLFVEPMSAGLGPGTPGPGYGTEVVVVCPFKIRNHGRSPAVVREVHVRGAITFEPAVAAAAVEPARSEVHWLVVEPLERPWQFKVKGSGQDWENLINGRGPEARVIVVGTLVYEAVYGARFERGFCWRYKGRAWVEEGGNDYNYDRPLSD